VKKHFLIKLTPEVYRGSAPKNQGILLKYKGKLETE
jgi:hypothetical protein